MLNDVMKDIAPLISKSRRRERGDAKEVLETNDIGTSERNNKRKE